MTSLHFTESKACNNVDLGFLGSSDGKESACNAGDLGLIPGSGRSLGGGNSYPLMPGEFQA